MPTDQEKIKKTIELELIAIGGKASSRNINKIYNDVQRLSKAGATLEKNYNLFQRTIRSTASHHSKYSNQSIKNTKRQATAVKKLTHTFSGLTKQMKKLSAIGVGLFAAGGLASGWGTFRKLADDMLRAGASSAKYGVTSRELTVRLTKLGKSVRLTRGETLALYSQFEQSIPVFSLERFEKVIKNITAVVGPGEKNIAHYAKALTSVAKQFGIIDIENLDPDRLEKLSMALSMGPGADLSKARDLLNLATEHRNLTAEQLVDHEKEMAYWMRVKVAWEGIQRHLESMRIYWSKLIAPAMEVAERILGRLEAPLEKLSDLAEDWLRGISDGFEKWVTPAIDNFSKFWRGTILPSMEAGFKDFVQKMIAIIKNQLVTAWKSLPTQWKIGLAAAAAALVVFKASSFIVFAALALKAAGVGAAFLAGLGPAGVALGALVAGAAVVGTKAYGVYKTSQQQKDMPGISFMHKPGYADAFKRMKKLQKVHDDLQARKSVSSGLGGEKIQPGRPGGGGVYAWMAGMAGKATSMVNRGDEGLERKRIISSARQAGGAGGADEIKPMLRQEAMKLFETQLSHVEQLTSAQEKYFQTTVSGYERGLVSFEKARSARSKILESMQMEVVTLENLLNLHGKDGTYKELALKVSDKTKKNIKEMTGYSLEDLHIATVRAQINDKKMKMMERESQLAEKLASSHRSRVQLASAEAGVAKSIISLLDNMAIGVGASVEARMMGVAAIGKEVQQLRKLHKAYAAELAQKPEDLALRTQMLKVESEIYGKMQDQASMARQLRDGWVSAVKSMNTGAGTFSKIIISQQSNIAQMLRMSGAGGPVLSAVSGARGNALGGVGYTSAPQWELGGLAKSNLDRFAYQPTAAPYGAGTVDAAMRGQAMSAADLFTSGVGRSIGGMGAAGFATQSLLGMRGNAGMRGLPPGTTINIGSINNNVAGDMVGPGGDTSGVTNANDGSGPLHPGFWRGEPTRDD